MSESKPCAIATCDGTVSFKARCEICPACQSLFYYWERKRPAEVVRRRANLRKYSDRLDSLSRYRSKR